MASEVDIQKGDRVLFHGRLGVVQRLMPGYMADVLFSDAPHRAERRAIQDLKLHSRPATSKAVAEKGETFREGDQVYSGNRPGTVQQVSEDGKAVVVFYDTPNNPEVVDVSQLRATRRRTRRHIAADRRREAEISRGRIRDTKKEPEAPLLDVVSREGAAVFALPDPPRLSEDGSRYCGNPIDGTAYYLAVARGQTSTSRWLRRGDVELTAGRETASDENKLRKYFLTQFLPILRERGQARITEEVIGPSQLVRQRRGKKSLPLHLATATRSSRQGIGRDTFPVSDEELKQIRKIIAGEHVPDAIRASLPFFTLRDDGRLAFYRMHLRSEKGQFGLRQLSPYARRRLRSPRPQDLDAGLVEQWGMLVCALSEASKKDKTLPPQGLSLPVARALVLAGAVTTWRRGEYSLRSQVVSDPFFADLEDGQDLVVNLAAKASNPFFSWVPASSPAGALLRASALDRSLGMEPCPSETDLAVADIMRQGQRAIAQYTRALGRVRSLFSGMASGEVPKLATEAPRGSPRKDVGRYRSGAHNAFTSLSVSLAAVARWFGRVLENAEDRGSEVDVKVIENLRFTEVGKHSLYDLFSNILHAAVPFMGPNGLITDPRWRQMRIAPKELQSHVRTLRARGYEVEVLDAPSGLYQQRVPLPDTQPLLKSRFLSADDLEEDQDAYADLQKHVRDLVVASPPLDRVIRSFQGARVRVHMPGRSLVLFLEGEKDVHPAEDFYAFVSPHIAWGESLTHLLRLSTRAQGKGVEFLRTGRWFDRDRPENAAALSLRRLLTQYASGGVTYEGESVDPHMLHEAKKESKKEKEERKAKGRPSIYQFRVTQGDWPVPVEQQLDENRALGLLMDGLHPKLLWGHNMAPDDAAAAVKELTLLVRTFSMLGGYYLSGPLVGSRDAGRGLGQMAAQVIRKQVSERAASPITGGDFLVYVTYNPVLFEVARMFWPDRNEKDPRRLKWTGILGSPHLLQDIDVVGRFGHAAQVTQQLTINATKPKDVRQSLGETLSRPWNFAQNEDQGQRSTSWDLSLLMTNKAKDPRSGHIIDTPPDFYSNFLLNWPIGGDQTEADASAFSWYEDPLNYLRTLKGAAEQAIARLSPLRRSGLPQGPGGRRTRELPTSVRPYIADHLREPAESALAQHAQADAKTREILRALDRGIQAIRSRMK